MTPIVLDNKTFGLKKSMRRRLKIYLYYQREVYLAYKFLKYKGIETIATEQELLNRLLRGIGWLK
jgi:hypothetical protein